VGRSGWLTWTNPDVAAIAKENLFRPTQFMTVYGMNMGGYVGGILGTVMFLITLSFIVTTPGRHVIQTNGKTDVMMKLFGPDNPAILIAEDDDGGTGKNARIAANLSTGQYLIQVRHYNKTAGTGAYSILVSR